MRACVRVCILCAHTLDVASFWCHFQTNVIPLKWRYRPNDAIWKPWLVKIRFRHQLCFCAFLCANQTKMHWAPHATIGVSGLPAFDYMHTRRPRLTVAVQSMTQLQEASVCDTRTVVHPARRVKKSCRLVPPTPHQFASGRTWHFKSTSRQISRPREP